MYYSEIEILKQREEEKKKRYSTISQGYYINNRILQFEKENILDKLTIYLPDTFRIMPFELAQVKYPSEFRPQMILTSLDLSVNFGFSVFIHEIQKEQVEELALRIRGMIESEKQSIFYEFEELGKVSGYYFTFRSHAMDIDLYNIQLIAPLKNQILQASFNCPYKKYKEWKKVALLVWETIEEIE